MPKSEDCVWNDDTTFVTFSTTIGVNRQFKLQAAILSITAFVLLLGGTAVASVIALSHKAYVPEDFMQKGTLSNLSQDQTSPHGRLWTTALVISSILLLTSMYPFWLYRSWVPWINPHENPLVHACFQSKPERILRTLWVVLPSVGFILTAIIPALSGVEGFYLVLTAVHNVAAPISMLCCMVMETV